VHAERLKQQGRLFPLSIFEMLTSTRRLRVSGFFVALTQRTHSQRAIGVISFHRFWIFCGGGYQSCRKVLRHARLWPILGHLDVERRNVTRADASSVLQRVIDLHPVAEISVWFEQRLELDAIDRSVDGHPPRREGRSVLADSGNRNTVDVSIADSVASKRRVAPAVR
jgi:hypothetical protein